MDLLTFIQNNFFHVAPVLIAGFFGLAIIVERVRALFVAYPLQNEKTFLEKITELVKRRKTAEAIALCDQYYEKPAAKVVKAALSRAHLPDESIEQGLQICVSDVQQHIQKRTAFLATIANVATLMGLLGTIVGLIHSFQAVANADPQQKSALLSAGISTAMNATMLGLFVAIPCMVAFAILTSKSSKIMTQVDEAAMKTMDALKLRFLEDGESSPESEALNERRVS